MKTKHITVVAFFIAGLVSASSCKKKENNAVDPVVTSTPLIPATTGWEKVGTVKYTYTNTGFAGQNSMEPIELMKVGDQVQLLYTENYRLTGVDGRTVYKGRYTAGSNDTMQLTKLNLAANGDESTYGGKHYPHFIPGTFTAIAVKYFTNGAPNKYLGVIDESSALLSSHFIHHPNRTPRIYSNGDVLDGTVNYSALAELDYFNSAAKAWTFINRTSHDTTQLVAYAPLRLTDGKLAGFNITNKGSKIYLSIADADPAAVDIADPAYKSRFMQEIPEFYDNYFDDKFPSIISSIQEGNTFTVVIGTYSSSASHATKLYAYKWTEGSTSFTPIYMAIPITI